MANSFQFNSVAQVPAPHGGAVMLLHLVFVLRDHDLAEEDPDKDVARARLTLTGSHQPTTHEEQKRQI